ncbi:MAG: heparinase II/III family protein [Phycisphaerae bacterium]
MLRGENPRAGEFRDYALKKLYERKVVPVLKTFGAGGGCTECGWYARHCLFPLAQAMELARRMEGYDGFAKAPAFFYQRLAYELYQPYPGLDSSGRERFAMEGDGRAAYSQAMEYPRLLRMMLAQYFRGSEMAGYEAVYRKPTTDPSFRVYDLLYEEQPDAPRDMKAVPLAHLAAGIGKVYARSDWGDDATWLRFECGDFFAQHQHFEAGNFEIFRREPLATESGVMTGWASPHALNWYIRTVAHNGILVYQEGQDWPFLLRDPEGKAPVANDGGQANTTRVADSVQEWNRRRESFHRGTIVAFDNRPEFLYVAGDYTAAYAATKVSLCTRQIVFIRPGTFVILDRVTSAKPEYAKAWLLHCHDEPRIDGRSIRIANGRGRLFVQTLLPERADISKIEGYTYGGQTFSPRGGPATRPAATSRPTSSSRPRRTQEPDIENLWRIEVRPSDAEVQTVFLHVLSTDDEPQPAELVRRGRLLGARGKGWEVLFDEGYGGTLTAGGKDFSLKQKITE